MFNLEAIQKALCEFKFDGWLLYDFHGSNTIARRILDISADAHTTRRFFYYIPAEGEPTKLNHRIETEVLGHLPGERRLYLRWQELEEELGKILKGVGRIAMEYSRRNAIPYVSVVDGGTIDLVKAYGARVESSGDLIQLFEAVIDDEQWSSHLEAERHLLTACSQAWQFIAAQVKEGKKPRETEIQSHIMDYFEKNDLFTDHPPIVGVGPNSGNPHYAPGPLTDSEVGKGDFILIDLWCRLKKPRAIFADYTRVGFVGESVPQKYTEIFNIVAKARDAAIYLVRNSLLQEKKLRGWEVDNAARNVIEEAGYGEKFIHRTGHNIAQDLHGNGTHIDNLETHDERLLLPRTCFSIEPGIYLDEFGVRSEVNVYIDENSHVHVTGDPQTEVLPILKAWG